MMARASWPHPPTPVATLRAGEEVDGVFACTRKDRLMTRTGTPYLALELRDRTGASPARAFRDADVLAGRFERGDLVRVRGRVERFRDELQIEVARDRAAAPATADPSRSCRPPTATSTSSTASSSTSPREVHDPGFRGAARRRCSATRRCAPACAARRARAAATTPTSAACSSTRSRSATLAQETCILHPRLDADLLLTAAIVHDIGKTREFTYGAEIGLSDEGRLLGHVELGLRMLDERAAQRPGARRRPPARARALRADAPRARRGARRGASPRAEALALYRINALDAAVKGALEHGPAAPAGA